jgi:hypothetical protein
MPVPEIDLAGAAFSIPGGTDSQLYAVVTHLTNDDLTTGEIDGSGAFDALMRGFAAHLHEEYAKNRITGAEYTKAYVALTQSAMASAVQFLLSRETAYWQAAQGQIGAVTAKVNHETAKVQYDSARYSLVNLLPAQVALVGKQKDLYTQQITSYQRDGEIKGAKLFTDAWITMKTLDEGLAAPTNFSNASLDAVLDTIKTNVPL